MGELRRTLRETGLEENTLLMFTSDHGDMMGAHGMAKKQKPWDESIRVPLLLHWPVGFGKGAREVKSLIGSEDLMPTLLGYASFRSHPALKAPISVSALRESVGQRTCGRDLVCGTFR